MTRGVVLDLDQAGLIRLRHSPFNVEPGGLLGKIFSRIFSRIFRMARA
jgi:hypothetical protein